MQWSSAEGLSDSVKIRQALSAQIGIDENKIWVLRKMGEVEDEILIMLRNPYGGDAQAYTRAWDPGEQVL